VDATNAMSSPFGCNKTFVSRIRHWQQCLLAFVFHITEDFALHPIPIVSLNITNKIVDQLIHHVFRKPLSKKIQNLFHVAVK